MDSLQSTFLILLLILPVHGSGNANALNFRILQSPFDLERLPKVFLRNYWKET